MPHSLEVSPPDAAPKGAPPHDLGTFLPSVAVEGAPPDPGGVSSSGDSGEETPLLLQQGVASGIPGKGTDSSTNSNSSRGTVMRVLRLHSVEANAALTHCLSVSRVSDSLRVVQLLLKSSSSAERLIIRSASIVPNLQQHENQQQQQQQEADEEGLLVGRRPNVAAAAAAAGTLGSNEQQQQQQQQQMAQLEGPAVSLIAPPRPDCPETESQVSG